MKSSSALHTSTKPAAPARAASHCASQPPPRRKRFAVRHQPCQYEGTLPRRPRMPGNGVGPAPRGAYITNHDGKAIKKGETARTVTEGAAARAVVAQPARRRAIIDPDRQVVSRVRHRFGAGGIDAVGRGDDAELL